MEPPNRGAGSTGRRASSSRILVGIGALVCTGVGVGLILGGTQSLSPTEPTRFEAGAVSLPPRADPLAACTKIASAVAEPSTTVDFIPSPSPSPVGEPKPLSKREWLAKAGEKDADTTYVRLCDEAIGLVPGVTVEEHDQLLAVARKRQARLKIELAEHPERGTDVHAIVADDLTAFERGLLGAERYARYEAAFVEVFSQ